MTEIIQPAISNVGRVAFKSCFALLSWSVKQIQNHQIDNISCTTSTEIFSTSWIDFIDVLYYH